METELEALEPMPETEEPQPDGLPQEPEPPARRRRRSGVTPGRASSSSSSGNARKDAGLKLIHRSFEDLFTELGMPPVGIMLPVTGTVCVRRAPEFADRIEYLAAQDPRVYRALMRFAKYGAWTGVARIASTLSIAVMVDVGAIHPDSFVAGGVADEVEIIRREAQKHGGGGPVSNGQGNASPTQAGVPSAWPAT